MSSNDAADELGVLRSKRNVTRYRILVGIAERQPAVNQREIADAIDITAQAVSDVVAQAADLAPDVRFGSPAAVQEAATKGLDVLLLSSTDRLSAHTDRLREQNLGYEVVDAADA